jgi:alpha-tubulin suppressor-like RCC1 family protein
MRYRLPVRVAALALVVMIVGCESSAHLGDGCARAGECTSPLVCRLSRCRNECVANRDCPVGATCLLDQTGLGACSVEIDRRCGSGGTECPAPLSCVGDRCVNTCTSAADCPSDGECREAPGVGLSFCFAPDREDGGPALDAGDAGSDLDGGTPPGNAATLCVGASYACAVHDGAVMCWGDNELGALGDGTDLLTARGHTLDDCGGIDCASTPVFVLDESGAQVSATALACGEYAVCAIIDGGRVACWGGSDSNGPVSGDVAVLTPRRAHVVTAFGAGFTSIAAGRDHFCASRPGSASDDVYCWGANMRGELGLGDAMLSDGIYEAGGVWAGGALRLGGSETCMLRGGLVSCAGPNDDGSLGPSATLPSTVAMPIEVPLGGTPVDIAIGARFAAALLSNGHIQTWGWAGQGGLGRTIASGSEDCTALSPSLAPCDRDPTDVQASVSFHRLWGQGWSPALCAQEFDGTAWCWGSHPSSGDCLFGASCPAPIRTPGFDGAIEIATGERSACARFEDGHVACLGDNVNGELGTGSLAPVFTTSAMNVCFGGC